MSQEMINILQTHLPLHRLSLVSQGEREGSCHKLYCNGRIADGFVFVTGGRCLYEFSDRTRFVASQGDMIYLSRDSVYSMTSFPEAFTYYYCNFEFVRDTSAPFLSLLVHLKNPRIGETLFSSLQKLWTQFPEDSFTECMKTLYDLYSIMIHSGSEEPYFSGDIRHTILRIKETMDHHPEDPALTVSAMAKEADVSEVYFRRVFHAVTGRSPNQYLSAARLDRARSLIGSEPGLSLEKVAELSGFCSASYLSAKFKKQYNMTIRDFKKGWHFS